MICAVCLAPIEGKENPVDQIEINGVIYSAHVHCLDSIANDLLSRMAIVVSHRAALAYLLGCRSQCSGG